MSQSSFHAGTFEIPDYCPAWISVEVKGVNVRVYEGQITHVCVAQPVYDYDYGDAPDPKYPTLSASGGASHLLDNKVYLGTKVDAEKDGQPNAFATGDDLNDTDDEDGVTFTSALTPGSNATATVVASASGILNAWIDFNGDGDWADLNEQIAVNKALAAGANTLTFPVPAGAVPDNTFARFRFSSAAGLTYLGPAPNGEVEDYAVRIEAASYQDGQSFKWEQPPIENDPRAKTPVYCGWDVPAYVDGFGRLHGPLRHERHVEPGRG